MSEFRSDIKEEGFTLPELMVVVVIIAILVTIAVPVYYKVAECAEGRACHANLRTIDEMSAEWQMMTFVEQDKIAGGFAGMFVDGGIPTCPCSGAYEHNTDNDNLKASCSIHGTY